MFIYSLLSQLLEYLWLEVCITMSILQCVLKDSSRAVLAGVSTTVINTKKRNNLEMGGFISVAQCIVLREQYITGEGSQGLTSRQEPGVKNWSGGHGGNAAYWLAFHGPLSFPTTTCLMMFLYTRLGVGVIRFSPEIPASPWGISFLAVCDSVPVTCGSVVPGDTKVPRVWTVDWRGRHFHLSSYREGILLPRHGQTFCGIVALLLYVIAHPLAVSFKLFAFWWNNT